MAYDSEELVSGNQVHLMHFAAGSWVDITSSVDGAGHVVCGETPSLSPFAVMQAPSGVGGPAVGGLVDLLASPDTAANGHSGYLLWVSMALAIVVATASAVILARRR